MAKALEIPWQEPYALYPEQREARLQELLPTGSDYYYYHILHQLSQLKEGDCISNETRELLEQYRNAFRYHSNLQILSNRCNVIDLSSKKTKEKFKSDACRAVEKLMKVSNRHFPPSQDIVSEKGDRYPSRIVLESKDQWSKSQSATDVTEVRSVFACFFLFFPR
tara:strand:+ start:1131 stop:1625 length:495 start_codon:yes stop_codon:yes gene_type:complete